MKKACLFSSFFGLTLLSPLSIHADAAVTAGDVVAPVNRSLLPPLGPLEIPSGAVVTLPRTGPSGDGLVMKYYFGVETFDPATFINLSRLEAWTGEKTRTPDLVTDSLRSGAFIDYGVGGTPFHTGSCPFIVYLEGCISIDETGTYEFGLNSDGGGVVWIDDKLVVSCAKDVGPDPVGAGSTGSIGLEAGLHKIQIGSHEGKGTQRLRLFIKGPDDVGFVRLPQSILQHGTGISSAYGLAGAVGGTLDLGDRGRFVLFQDNDTVYSGALCGGAKASLIKHDAGRLTLSGDSTAFRGELRAARGTLAVGSGFSLSNVCVRVEAGGTFSIDRAGPTPIRSLTGSGRLVITGGAHVTVSDSAFTGTVETRNGTFTPVATGLRQKE